MALTQVPPQMETGGPAFSAYVSTASQTVSNVTFTKVLCQTEEFDTSSAYDNATNYRFQPTTAGYYTISGNVVCTAATATNQVIAAVYKNGAEFKRGSSPYQSASVAATISSNVSALVYLNGSSDYVELWAYVQGTGTLSLVGGAAPYTYFQGVLIKAG